MRRIVRFRWWYLGLGLALVLWAMAAGDGGEMGLAQPPCDVWVEPGESIQRAITAASPGTVICLKAGTWEGNLEIRKSLTLLGQGRQQTVIKGRRSGYPVIWIESDSEIEVVIAWLTIAEAKGYCADHHRICAHGLLLSGKAKATIQDSLTSDNGSDGIEMGDSSQAEIRGSTIEGNGTNGYCK